MIAARAPAVQFSSAQARRSSPPVAARPLSGVRVHNTNSTPAAALLDTTANRRNSVRASAADGSAAATSTATAPPKTSGAPELTIIDKDTWAAYHEAAGDKLVIVDYFTDRCGPCKMIYPQLVELSAQLEPAAVIVKFNCNQHNKEMAKSLGIKVVPTFHLFRKGEKIAEMTGAKVDKLRALIDDHIKA